MTAVGIQQLLYLGGYNLALNPASISETPFRAETAERTANSFSVIDRPYLFPGAPDVVQKMVWQLSWPTVNSADYLAFTEIESLPGFFDFTNWKPLMETFSGDGVATEFILLRRRADTVLTPPAGTWTPVTKVNGSVVTNPTFGTPDTTYGTTKITFGAAPSAVGSNIRLFYVPLYKVRVVSPSRNYSVPFAETRALTLEEI